MVLALLTARAVKLGEPSENQLMAAIGAALDDAQGDAGSSEVSDAIEAADKAGDLPSAEEKKDVGKPDATEPPPVTEEDEAGNKKSEVEILMEKADHEEAQSKWLKSDAYKKQQQKKKDEQIKSQQKEVQELEDTLGQVEASKQLIGKSKAMGDRELHAAEDDDYLQSLFEKYAKEGKGGVKMITKDKAYIAAGKAIEHWRGIKGDENSQYLKDNF